MVLKYMARIALRPRRAWLFAIVALALLATLQNGPRDEVLESARKLEEKLFLAHLLYLRAVMSAKVGPIAPPRKSGSPWRSRSPTPQPFSVDHSEHKYRCYKAW